MKKIVTLLAIIIFLTGCVTMGRQIDASAVDKIIQGKTTRDEVIALLGPPSTVSKNSNGTMVFVYSYVSATPKPESFIPLVGVFVSGSNVESQMVSVTFGGNNIVKNVTSTYSAMESSMNGVTGGNALENPGIK